MEIIAVTDAVKLSSFSSNLLLLHRHESSLQSHLSLLSDVSSEPSSSSGVLCISAGISPVDSMAPPIVRWHSHRTVPRTLARKIRRTRKRSLAGDGEEDGFLGGGDDGPFGGSGGGSGSGKGWNFDGNGGPNWEDESESESSSLSSSFFDPAFGFFYEVISWIVLSNCIHFAFKRVVRIVSDGIEDPSREKVPVRFVPVC